VLHDRDDFADLLTTVGEQTGAGAALVEKDYWVTEALRVIAASFFPGVVFKGGTSLSKAWNLIERFSEDIDLLIRTEGEALDSGGGRDRYMKEIAAAVAAIEGLTPTSEGARSERGISRTSVYVYESRAPAREGLNTTIMLEMGIRGRPHPAEVRPLRSMLAAALAESGLDHDSLEPFALTVLHPRRTLVEKLSAVHSACERWSEGETTALQRQGRHLTDIHELLADPAIAEFSGGEEYIALIPDVDELGRTFFPRDHRTPPNMRFADSRAVRPDAELRAALEAEHARGEFLFYGTVPTLDAIYARLEEFRARL
jgi:hypothetical protein